MLVYKRNEYDRTSRVINLIVQQELVGYGRFPAAYEYLEETDERPYPIIRVVAAPGVSVLLQNFPDAYVAGPDVPDLEIFRVQDPELVPPMATDIVTFTLTGRDEVNPPASSFIIAPPAVNSFQIDRLPSQVIIRHLASDTAIIIRVPQLSRTPSETRDARARFAYEIDPQGSPWDADRPLLKIVKTPAVELDIAIRVIPRLGERLDPNAFLVYYAIYEVDAINAVPPQGYSLIPESNWRRIRSIRRVPPLEEELAKAVFDVTIGLIPVVGDIVDVAELIYGAVTGRDRWGRRVTAGDLVIMGVGALLPFVGAAALRSGARLLGRFGRRAQTVEELISMLRQASLNAEEADLIRAMESLIRAGRHPTTEMYERFVNLLRRVHGDYPSLGLFLNAERTGFIHPKLQEAYQQYRQRRVRAGERPASPQEWALRQTTGEPRRILQALLGQDYARGIRRVVAQRFINVGDIPRPPGLSEQQFQQHLERLLREFVKLTERLDVLTAQRTTGSLIPRFLSRRRIRSGHFRILKGNIGEILSSPIQHSILQQVAERMPNARLISGVRIRRMTEEGRLARSVLFTDNIIAVERGGNLHIHAVFEVKSGYEGGLEAQSQIFRWIEERITDGSQLVLPRGTRILSADGTGRILQRERIFTFNPESTEAARVINLAAADRHIIAGRGSSHLGIDSPEQVAANVHRHMLDVSSAEMDYLAGQVIATTSW